MGYKTPVPPDWSIPHYQSGAFFIIEAISGLFDSATEALCAQNTQANTLLVWDSCVC
jgi:hypothetical protein